MKITKLQDAIDSYEFGGKASSLAKGLQFNLPIPDGFVLNVQMVRKILDNNCNAINALKFEFNKLASAVVVRSSALEEDSEEISFAGQYLSVLNVISFHQLLNAVRQVANSELEDSVKLYRKKHGLSGGSRMSIIIQKMIDVEKAGVLFTENPVTKTNEFLIEASWGFGEAVVAGMIIPDSFKLNTQGKLIEQKIGVKDFMLSSNSNGGLEEMPLDWADSIKPTLNNDELQNLYQLGSICKDFYGRHIDIEWGIKNKKTYLFQCRPITT